MHIYSIIYYIKYMYVIIIYSYIIIKFNNYIKYLGKDYVNLILKKLQLVIDEDHKKMYIMRNNKYEELFMSMFSDNQERNSGRRGR